MPVAYERRWRVRIQWARRTRTFREALPVNSNYNVQTYVSVDSLQPQPGTWDFNDTWLVYALLADST